MSAYQSIRLTAIWSGHNALIGLQDLPIQMSIFPYYSTYRLTDMYADYMQMPILRRLTIMRTDKQTCSDR